MEPHILSADDVEAALSRSAAVDVITAALRDGLDPSADPARAVVTLASGQLLLMPSQTAAAAGLKAVTVAPDNPRRGLPRIQGTYLLFDAEALGLKAVIDGTALTNLRTPAVSAAVIAPALSRFDHPLHVVVYGAGPQAIGHAEALRATSRVRLAEVTFVVPHPERVDPAPDLGCPSQVLATGDAAVSPALRSADVVVCATTARTALFDADEIAQRAVVVAVGSHEPDARELPGPLLGRSTVVVEDVSTALREAGDIIMAVADGAVAAADLVTMAAVVRGETVLADDRPVVFKSTGMAWQDLVVADAVYHRHLVRSTTRGC